MNIDILVSQNSRGKLNDMERWNLKKKIEIAPTTEYPCRLCYETQPLIPSKKIMDSQYCRQHLLYALALGKDINNLH